MSPAFPLFSSVTVSGKFGFPSEIEDSAIFELARCDNGVRDQK